MNRATDTDFLAAALADGEWHAHQDILERSFRERGCGLTIHSRAATLRQRGYAVQQRSERADGGRVRSFYRIVAWPLEASDATTSPSPGVVPPTSDASSGPDTTGDAADNPGPLTLFDETRGAYWEAA